jgi:hypothetical protein
MSNYIGFNFSFSPVLESGGKVVEYESPSALLVHEINHGLDNDHVVSTVWEKSTGNIIVPSSVTASANTLILTFTTPRDIKVTLIGRSPSSF